MELQSVPTEIDDAQRRLVQLKIAESQLLDETEPSAVARLEEIRKEIAKKNEELAELNIRWEKEKSGVGDVHQLRKTIAEKEQAYKTLDGAIKRSFLQGKPADNSEFQKLSDLDTEIRSLREQLAKMETTESKSTGTDGERGRRRRE